MNFNNMHYFMVMAEEGSISAASRKLFISQQSLSEQLKKIETELGTPLFKRGSKLTLTLAGKCFYDGCKRLTSGYDSLLFDIQTITASRYNKLSIGVPTFSVPAYLPAVLTSFQKKYPEYKITVVKRQHSDVTHNMNGVDLYLSSLPLNSELENCVILENDPYCVTFQRSLAEQVYGEQWDKIEEQLLQTQDLSLLSDMPYAVLYDRYGQMAAYMSSVFNEYGFHPNEIFSSENDELNLQVCENGLAAILSPSSTINARFFDFPTAASSNMLSFPVNVTSFETKLAISHPKGIKLHPAEYLFIAECKEYFKEHPVY